MDLAYRDAGDGPPILLIHGGAEDLTMHTPLAEAIARQGFRVIWYDRRGTGGSTRQDWPGGGAAQHADDAAALLEELEAVPATVVGFSSGGAVALALAERHPEVLRHVIAWEPAALGVLPYAEDVFRMANGPYEAYLAEHPGDWVGGYHVVLDSLSEGRADHEAPLVKQSEPNAEAALRDDGPLIVRYRPAAGRLPADKITLAVTEGVSPLHRDIAEILGEEIGRPPVVLAGAREHEDYLLAPVQSADLIVALASELAPALSRG
jgi:pimeloyl-ACP methyl ester carboxylesterase